MTGEISGLFPKDELQIMAGEIRQFATKRPDYSDTPDFLVKNFFDTVRQNLHVVLCFSPVNAKFADRARKFPGLINGCALDWFLSWPSEALIAVSEGFIGAMEIQCEPETKKNLMQHMAFVHHMIVESCDEYYMKMRRRVYQTPRSYLSFLADYQKVYAVKLGEIEQKASRVQVQRFQLVLDKVRAELGTMLGAIRGEVVITKQIIDAINSVYDARVPHFWTYNPAGDEISWLAPTIGLWVSGLAARDKQLRDWLGAKGRPKTYWFPGWFNPAGFLTAVQQEVTRAHAADKWALDGVALNSEVTEYDRVEQVRNPPPEGVYISGLFLDGATWDKSVNSLAESAPKVLFCDMPILFVTAVTKSQRKGADLGPFGGFVCPVYKYVKRTDKYIIFSVTLACQQKPEHWILRGVALLCFTN